MAHRWGVIGCGNLAQAIFGGAVKRGALAPSDIIVTDVNAIKVEEFSKATGVGIAEDMGAVAQRAEIIVVATKPQDVLPVLEVLKAHSNPGRGVVSLAAGVPAQLLLHHLGGFGSVTRVMANTPALVQQGFFWDFLSPKKCGARRRNRPCL